MKENQTLEQVAFKSKFLDKMVVSLPLDFFFSWSYIMTTSITLPKREKNDLKSVSVMLEGNPPRNTFGYPPPFLGFWRVRGLQGFGSIVLKCPNYFDVSHCLQDRHCAVPSIKRMGSALQNNLHILGIGECYKTKASWPSRFRILHDHTINDLTISGEVPLQIVLRSLPGETPNKKFSAKKKKQVSNITLMHTVEQTRQNIVRKAIY